MFSLLLAIIYLAFIGLGLPDSLLGSAWPVMHAELGAPLPLAGLVSMVITAGTVVSSLLSDRLTTRFGADKVTLVSVAGSALSLFGFALAPSALWLFVWAIPYGLCAGSVDAALNHTVATRFNAGAMAWLHCFWGVGACISPYVMGAWLSRGNQWRLGYGTVGVLVGLIALVLLCSLRLWKTKEGREREETPSLGMRRALRVKGVKLSALSFLAYMALEATTGIWVSTYLVKIGGADPVTAARTASLFYIGITAARFVSGFVADRFSDRALVRFGVGAMLAGTFLMLLPGRGFTVAGLVVTGIGGAPLYPSLVHAAPAIFGREHAQSVIGLQMATAYVGSTLGPPLFGALLPLKSLPWLLFFLAVGMLLTTEGLWLTVRKRKE